MSKIVGSSAQEHDDHDDQQKRNDTEVSGTFLDNVNSKELNTFKTMGVVPPSNPSTAKNKLNLARKMQDIARQKAKLDLETSARLTERKRITRQDEETVIQTYEQIKKHL